MSAATQLVEEFFAAIYRLDFDAAIALMTEDASYHDLPLPTDPTVGKDAIRAKLGYMIAGGVTSMDYEIRHLLADDERGRGNGGSADRRRMSPSLRGRTDAVVLVERSETWHFPSGAAPVLRVMCSIELEDGKIARWREYWNGEELMSQMPPEFFEGIEQADTGT